MKPDDNYVQCEMRLGSLLQTAWIPQKHARRGKVLRLKNAQGEWVNGWEVIKTFAVMPAALVLPRARRPLPQSRMKTKGPAST